MIDKLALGLISFRVHAFPSQLSCHQYSVVIIGVINYWTDILCQGILSSFVSSLLYSQNCCVFGLSPSPGILETRKHDVSETGSISVLKCKRKTPTQLGPLERWRLAISKGPNWVGFFPPHLRTKTDPVSETSCSLVSGIPDNGQSPKP
jgi:hypothetical protein